MNEATSERLHLRMQGAYEETYKRAVIALKAAGFDVIMEIDLQETLARKVDGRIKPHKVIFVCDPEQTHRALTVAPQIGFRLLHPVAVSQTLDDEVEISAADPLEALHDAPEAYLKPIVEDLRARLEKVIQALHN
ncbi:MAG: DUF302 domain-containing protein [Chloroflexi bacterium]|nr:DUF302 domain-containing protein [Chloroflexota bacterium]